MNRSLCWAVFGVIVESGNVGRRSGNGLAHRKFQRTSLVSERVEHVRVKVRDEPGEHRFGRGPAVLLLWLLRGLDRARRVLDRVASRFVKRTTDGRRFEVDVQDDDDAGLVVSLDLVTHSANDFVLERLERVQRNMVAIFDDRQREGISV